MEEIAHPELIEEIEAYCDKTGVTRTAFGVMATNDPGLFWGLKKGRELRRATLARVRAALGAD